MWQRHELKLAVFTSRFSTLCHLNFVNDLCVNHLELDWMIHISEA